MSVTRTDRARWLRRGAPCLLLPLWLVASCAGAGGTETDNPDDVLTDFSSSSCKTEPPGDGRQALVLASDAEGLQCVEWEAQDDGALRLRLLNFPEPCGKQYYGRVERGAEGELEVSVYKDTCTEYRCGNCVFDFDFQLAHVAADEPLRLRLGTAACASNPPKFDDEIKLPVDEQPSGIRCRPLHGVPLQQYASARGSCGERNMPCGDCLSVDSTACAAGTTCQELENGDSRCLTSCTTDDDCLPGLTSCVDGACRAPHSW